MEPLFARNPFEAGARKVIPAVLVYLRQGDEFLMLHRNSPDRPQDFHAGKWNGLGGKLELEESPLEAAVREVREESGWELEPTALRALGVLTFPLFKPARKEDWVCFVFEAEVPLSWRARIPVGGLAREEGTLHWVKAGDLLGLPLWPGDREFLPQVVARQPFLGTIWYRDQQVERAWVQELGFGSTRADGSRAQS